jgi:mitogen-activated protein kinase 1/3
MEGSVVEKEDAKSAPKPVIEKKTSLKPMLQPMKPVQDSLDSWTVGPKYVVQKFIGKGSYATVVEAVNRETGEKVAIKKFCNVFRSYEYALRVLREVLLLQNIRHPCIIESLDVIIQGKKEDFPTLYLVLEYFPRDLKKQFASNTFLTEE